LFICFALALFYFLRLPTQYNSLASLAQTVLLTAGPLSKLQNSRYFPKFSEAVLNPKKIHDVNEFHKWRCAGKPEMVRTSARPVAPTRLV
jgi:hypothetical protein